MQSLEKRLHAIERKDKGQGSALILVMTGEVVEAAIARVKPTGPAVLVPAKEAAL